MSEPLVNSARVAAELGVSRSAVSNWLQRGVLPEDLRPADTGLRYPAWPQAKLPALKAWHEGKRRHAPGTGTGKERKGMSYAKERERRLRLEQFIDQHGGVIGTALEVYARQMREQAEPLLARYEEIKDDPERKAEQDGTWITTLGLKHTAGLFGDSADRADKAAKELQDLEESAGDDDF
jgi:hypothetical protein